MPWIEPLWLAPDGQEGIQRVEQRAFTPDAAQEADLLGDWSNKAAWACITPLGITNNVAFGAGLVAPPPADFPLAVAEHAANLALKYCAPVVYPPGDFTRSYNKDNSGRCGYTFDQPTWTGQYVNLMGITAPWSDVFPGVSWGDFGQPVVVHWNTDVDVSLRAPAARRLTGDDYRLPLGVHSLTWRGDTQVELSDFLFTYIPGGTKVKFLMFRKYLSAASRAGLGNFLDDVVQLFEALNPGGGISWPTMYNEEIQRVAVIDSQRPSLSGLGTAGVEAIEPGGISRNTLLYQLQRTLSVTDNCDANPEIIALNERSLPAFLPVGSSYTVEWAAEDNGPHDLSGAVNRSASFYQTFTVRDTLPPVIVPPPDVVIESSNLPTAVTLGHPGTFDLADLNPSVTSNACTLSGVTCDNGLTRFPAGKTTVTWTAVDHAGNRSTTTQYVNVKSIGSNHTPSAQKASAGAISYEPVTLTLKASDPDKDRVWFEIEDQPDNGYFHAPLYPYFIQDYRLANVAELDFGDYCSKEENRGKYVPVNWPEKADFMAVADDGTVYVHDNGIARCNSFDNGVFRDYRVAIFRPDGTWDQQQSSFDVKDMEVDWEHERIFTSRHNQGGDSWVDVFDLDLNRVVRYRTDHADNPFREPKNAAIDFDRGLLYVTNGFPLIGTAQLKTYHLPDPPPGYDPGSTSLSPVYLGEFTVPGRHAWQDLQLDSAGNLYASERDDDRIYKWGVPVEKPGGGYAPGELIGWMGRCDSGPGCDIANGRSFGYSCTDATCSVSETGGSRPGQFDFPQAIAHDNNDILYVTDYYNLRVQRFTPDGYFAGQAISECDGSCFVLGDFGRPSQVSVNSDHFYVLDKGKNMLHVFKTTPITRITENSAEIVYQSDNNFVGADTFSFLVSDGLADSKRATVTINVSRNYRPPMAEGPLAVTTREDNRVRVPVDGYDPDEPLDTVTFKAIEGPANGRFLRQGESYYYEPAPDFEGEDTFTYAATDGKLTSEPQPVTITVTPVNDPPRFTEDETRGGVAGFAMPMAGAFFSPGRLSLLGTSADPLPIGRGFNTLFTAAFEDPDRNDRHTVTVDWGDGTPRQAEGKLLEDGTMTGPVLSEGQTGGGGSVTAEHIFEHSGDFNVKICVSDNVAVDGNGNKSVTPASVTTCTTIPVRVQAMVDLLVDIQPSADPYPLGDPFSYDLVVTNHAPDGGGGLTAGGIKLVDTLDARLKGAAARGENGTCTIEGIKISCTLDPLPPGKSTVIHIDVEVPASVKPGMVLANHVTYSLDQPTQSATNENGSLVSVVAAADFIVNTIEDAPDAVPGDGLCAAANGDCSLRAAVQEANAHPAANTISVADWQFVLQQELVVRTDVTMTGLGAGRTLIAGGGENRLFNVAAGKLSLAAFALQGGQTAGDGGAIANSGTASLTAVQISGSHADGSGGAIWNEGSLTLKNSSISGNNSDGGAGGLANNGSLLLENTTISGNKGKVGGLSSPGTAVLSSVTVSHNHATGNGGGILGSAAMVSLRNTIVGGNTGSGPDCSGGFTSKGYNLLGNKSGCTVGEQKGSDIVGQDPQLSPLDLSGAETLSHVPQGSSPVIDRGACDLAADQRGVARPLDGNLDSKAACDIGAVEAEPLRVMLPLVRG